MKVSVLVLISLIVATTAINSVQRNNRQGDLSLVEKKKKGDAGPPCKPQFKPDGQEEPNHAVQARRNLRDLRDNLHENNRKAQGHEPQGALYQNEEDNCVNNMPSHSVQKRRS